jgi:hypothetical protein
MKLSDYIRIYTELNEEKRLGWSEGEVMDYAKTAKELADSGEDAYCKENDC